MPIIEPPTFSEGTFNLPAVRKSGSSSLASSIVSGNRMNPKHVKDLLNQHHENSMQLLDHSFTLQTSYDEGAHRRAIEAQTLGHEQAKELETHRAGIAATQIAQQHQQSLEAATHGAKLENKLAGANHRRTLELHGAINSAAQAGTELNITFPHGGNASYTKAGQQPAAVAAAEEPAPTRGPGWMGTPGGAKTLPITTKPAVSSAPEKPKGFVTRDPKTGRAVSLKSGSAKPPKKSSAKQSNVSGASVTRDPKTGRAVSKKK